MIIYKLILGRFNEPAGRDGTILSFKYAAFAVTSNPETRGVSRNPLY